MSSPSVEAPGETRTLTFAQAINEALTEELRRDEAVFVIGEDVAEAGTPFKVLAGLVEEFGTERVLDSPITVAAPDDRATSVWRARLSACWPRPAKTRARHTESKGVNTHC